MELDIYEQRVLGCLIEKQHTTPDVYPLSLNALRTACNQSTNRDPVLALDEEQVREAAQGLYRQGLVRIAAAGQGSRATKFRHIAEEALPASDAELALLAVLLLRGAQTIGELRTRTERIHAFGSLDEVGYTLDDLGRRGLIQVLEREPGRKESRYAHQLGPRDPEVAAAAEAAAAEYRAQLAREREDQYDAGGAPPADGSAADAAAVAHDEAAASWEQDEPAVAAAPVAAAPPRPAAPPARHEPDPASPPPSIVEQLLDRIDALERRVDELEDLVSS